MSDDLANCWGRYLVFESDGSTRRRVSDGSRAKFKHFASAVKHSCGSQFVLGRVVGCGSDANMYAMFEATEGDPDVCFVACGSYVCGDDGHLANWTSSGKDSFQLSTNIALPEEIKHERTHWKTIALPYHIKMASDSSLCHVEDECANELHRRCLLQRLLGRPLKCLLMELVLCGNGGELSGRFLEKLAALASLHSFSVIVDECITGGRVGPTMLLSQSMPRVFQSVISHVTMSKWMGVGMVLRSVAYERDRHKPAFPRGMTTQPDTDEALYCWKQVEARLSKIPARRMEVLRSIRADEAISWGRGLLIFSERHRKDTSSRGLKNRFLPLNQQMPVAKIGFTGSKDGYRKQEVAKRMRDRVKAWCAHSAMQGDKVDRALCHKLSDGFENACIKNILNSIAKSCAVEKRQARASWTRAVSNGLVSVQMKTHKRLLLSATTSICCFN